jgi:hypothetical protein
MTIESHADFDKNNRDFISNFIKDAEIHKDEISGSVLATMSQFIGNVCLTITKESKGRGWVTPIEIIDSQVKELRRCVLDLEAYKERLTTGVTHQ